MCLGLRSQIQEFETSMALCRRAGLRSAPPSHRFDAAEAPDDDSEAVIEPVAEDDEGQVSTLSRLAAS